MSVSIGVWGFGYPEIEQGFGRNWPICLAQREDLYGCFSK
jgi:hypothetical protein